MPVPAPVMPKSPPPSMRRARLRRDRLAGRHLTPAPQPVGFEGLLSDPPRRLVPTQS